MSQIHYGSAMNNIKIINAHNLTTDVRSKLKTGYAKVLLYAVYTADHSGQLTPPPPQLLWGTGTNRSTVK